VRSVGVRELKTHASEILRGVRERGETVELTLHGRAIALVGPVRSSPARDEDLTALWTDIDRLADEIAAHWPEGVSAEDAVNDVRRDL
jgi:prevent-host-death family protein